MHDATSVRSVQSRWHALVERLLPWFDVDEEKVRNQRSEDIRARSVAARTEAERTRKAYQLMERRIRRGSYQDRGE